MCYFSNLGLMHPSQRSQGTAQLLLSQTEQEIRLILAWIDPFAQDGPLPLMLNDGVVTRRNVKLEKLLSS